MTARQAARFLGLLGVLLLVAGCQRKLRAIEREAAAKQAADLARAKEAARRAELPIPPEPPVELLRVPSSGIPCDVDEVLANKCRRCHTVPARHGAPLAFLTWEDTRQDRFGQPLYTVMGRAVRTNFMPYRTPANPPILPLTEIEKQIILKWTDAGAPRAECEPDAASREKPPELRKQTSPTRVKSATTPANSAQR